MKSLGLGLDDSLLFITAYCKLGYCIDLTHSGLHTLTVKSEISCAYLELGLNPEILSVQYNSHRKIHYVHILPYFGRFHESIL